MWQWRLVGFFHNDAVSYAENLFGKSYCYYLEESKADIVCAFTVSNASIFTKYLPNARKKKVGKHVPHIKQDLIYPAVLIGRLGISTKFQHLHIGTEVMDLNCNRKRDTVMEQQNKRKSPWCITHQGLSFILLPVLSSHRLMCWKERWCFLLHSCMPPWRGLQDLRCCSWVGSRWAGCWHCSATCREG